MGSSSITWRSRSASGPRMSAFVALIRDQRERGGDAARCTRGAVLMRARSRRPRWRSDPHSAPSSATSGRCRQQRPQRSSCSVLATSIRVDLRLGIERNELRLDLRVAGAHGDRRGDRRAHPELTGAEQRALPPGMVSQNGDRPPPARSRSILPRRSGSISAHHHARAPRAACAHFDLQRLVRSSPASIAGQSSEVDRGLRPGQRVPHASSAVKHRIGAAQRTSAFEQDIEDGAVCAAHRRAAAASQYRQSLRTSKKKADRSLFAEARQRVGVARELVGFGGVAQLGIQPRQLRQHDSVRARASRQVRSRSASCRSHPARRADSGRCCAACDKRRTWWRAPPCRCAHPRNNRSWRPTAAGCPRPISAMILSGSTTFPIDLDILRPCPSSAKPCVRTAL